MYKFSFIGHMTCAFMQLVNESSSIAPIALTFLMYTFHLLQMTLGMNYFAQNMAIERKKDITMYIYSQLKTAL